MLALAVKGIIRVTGDFGVESLHLPTQAVTNRFQEGLHGTNDVPPVTGWLRMRRLDDWCANHFGISG
jgi:hypothetical protein